MEIKGVAKNVFNFLNSIVEKGQSALATLWNVRARYDVVPVEQVHRLVQKFNKVNFVDKTKVNCKVIVDTFAGGSGILEQVSSQLRFSVKPVDFKEYEFIYVDHPEIKKSIKLDSRLDMYDGQANGGVCLVNYICAPPEGGELVAFMYLTERCRDFCAFLFPVTWINPIEAGMLQRAWWSMKCLEKRTSFKHPLASSG
ncbi:hypothetical protein CYMTET_6366 [Cymbomonas tetramitiformis]|uniref:Uncharacterized protein n=1 Tax=Cymbomonas tetramitiformis TaxID=36881 RepID=A0AAE0GXN7_9CHLO|nr:hypothetical protein CYMTET_6366 [Cymbomonas tetramitiformis]